MKKLIYLIVAIVALSLIISGCGIPVVPPTEQDETSSLTKGTFGSTIYVDSSYSGVGDGQEASPFTTIQAALDDAVDGDTIIVAAGTYTNDIWDSGLGIPAGYRITKSVTLLGAQAGNDPAGSTDRGGETILVRTNGLPYSLYVSDITIDGFMFGNSNPNTGGRLIISGNNVTIRNCIIQNTPSASSGHGVYIEPGAQNALIEYNTFYNTGWEAIASWQVSGAVISHNHISSSGEHAIQMMGHAGSNNEISYNHISGIVDKNAIQYWGGPGAIIIYNVIDGGNTMYDGIWLDAAADGSIVSNNQISDTIYAGINVRGGCTDATVTYNELSGCGTGIETHVGATGASVNYNNIEGNSYGVRNYDNVILDATRNWWGHASGPGGEYGRVNKQGKVIGKGDAVSNYVNWDPWLSQPTVPPTQILNKWDLEGTFVAHPGYNWGGLAEGATWDYSIHIKEAISGDFSVGSIHFSTGDIEVIGIVEQTKRGYNYGGWASYDDTLAVAGRTQYNNTSYNFLLLYCEKYIWLAISNTAELEPYWTDENVWGSGDRDYQLHSIVPDEPFDMEPKEIH